MGEIFGMWMERNDRLDLAVAEIPRSAGRGTEVMSRKEGFWKETGWAMNEEANRERGGCIEDQREVQSDTGLVGWFSKEGTTGHPVGREREKSDDLLVSHQLWHLMV